MSPLTPPSARRDNGSVDAREGPVTGIAQDCVTQALAEGDDLLRDVAAALQHDSRLDPDTVRHTLALLRLDPLTRLNRSLLRGRAATAYRT